jgi:glycosyltransferase involved in cell wall biosynthesis
MLSGDLCDIPVFHEVAAGHEHAWFVGLGDTHDLAAKMDFVIHRYEEARTKAEKALAFARERYDIAKIARQHEEFYLEVIEDYKA